VATVKKIDVGDRTVRVAEYHDLDLARAAAERWRRWIIMGDCNDHYGSYWVCRPVVAKRLADAGYEMIW